MSDRAGAAPPPPEDHVFLALPTYGGGFVPEALPGICFPSESRRVTARSNCASLLAHNFNRLFCDMLNEKPAAGYTHFAMMHSDQAPPTGWLDVLLEEMQAHRADVISAVVAIKDTRGLTSTGRYDPAAGGIKRLTLTELWDERLPETFTVGDFADHKSGQQLMVNTGLWVAKLSGWEAEFPGFNIEDRIVRDDDGRYRAGVFPEDWKFSQWCHERGLKVCATRKLKVVHHGGTGFANDRPWGEWLTDKGDSY